MGGPALKPALPNAVIRIPAKDSYSTAGERLMGRQSANEGFLQAWFKHTTHPNYWCLARTKSEAQVFAQVGERIYPDPAKRPVFRWLDHAHIHRVTEVGAAYLPGPQVAEMAWVRRRDPQAKAKDFSLIGMTHTTCEIPIQDSLANMLIAPVQVWDAQICPSISVQTMVHRLLQDEATWLQQRLGATQMPAIQLPVIPLGVDMTRYDLPPSEKANLRTRWRARWQLQTDEVCVLYMGRLDLRTKANLYPMLDALEQAQCRLTQQQGPRLVLALVGWYGSEWDRVTIEEALLKSCPNVRVVHEDGRKTDVRDGVWHAADVFTSLVDNVQETFGLTPLEAMASGLPVVVSDYDGYKESVRDGVDGHLIRTWQPSSGHGVTWMNQHADHLLSYPEYLARVNASVAVDVHQAAEAYVALALHPAQRKAMGQNGQQRVRAEYDWARVIVRFQALLTDLSALRADASRFNEDPPKATAPRYPRRADPYHSFSHYPSQPNGPLLLAPGPLCPSDIVTLANVISGLMDRPIYQGVRALWTHEEIRQVLTRVIDQGSMSASTLHPDERLLGWMMKSGLLSWRVDTQAR